MKSVDDRMDFDSGQAGSFVMGVVAGTIIGAVAGLLFAPKAGAELRSDLSERASGLADEAAKGYRRAASTASDWADRGWRKGHEAYERTREAVSRGKEEAERYVRDAAVESEPAASKPRLS